MLLLTLFAALSLVSTAPAPSYPSQITPDLDFNTTYLQFFRVKQLIDQINIKRFKEFGHSPESAAEAKSLQAPIIPTEASATPSAEPAAEEQLDNIPEIDLTDEAIMSDTAGIVSRVEPALEAEVTTAAPAPEDIATSLPPVAEIDAEDALITMPCLNNDCLTVSDEEVTTIAAPDPEVTTITAPEISTEEEDLNPKLVISEVPVNPGPAVEEDEDESLNEIDTGSDKFFVSKDTVSAARKYGYKILLKKVGGKEVPVGKIKFSLPTIVEITPEDDKVVVEAIGNVAPKMETVEEVIITTETPSVIDATTQAVLIAAVYTDAPVDVTTSAPAEEELTTLLSVSDLLPEPITAVIPAVEIGEVSISDSVIKISEETETALEEIKNKTSVTKYRLLRN